MYERCKTHLRIDSRICSEIKPNTIQFVLTSAHRCFSPVQEKPPASTTSDDDWGTVIEIVMNPCAAVVHKQTRINNVKEEFMNESYE